MNKEELLLYVGNKIRELREKHGLTQQEFADKTGLTKQKIYYYESGLRDAAQDNIFNIAEIFDVSINYFFPPIDGDETTEPEPYDPDVQGILDLLDRRTDYKILFSKTSHLKNGQLDKIAKILEASLPDDDED